MANVTLGGNPITVNGNVPKPGDTVQDFTVTGQDLKDVSLKDFAGKAGRDRLRTAGAFATAGTGRD